ncbi:MAG: hypothetical protein IPF92_06940 [Myxococcales bacterium]|nr:hypothetical protein [Myxococcales bacterium]MBL0192776.1 hypothetical protein [Myxococcales bacterium]
MKFRRGVGCAVLVGLGCVIPSCGDAPRSFASAEGDAGSPHATAAVLPQSATAARRLAELGARLPLARRAARSRLGQVAQVAMPDPTPRRVAVDRFEVASGSDALHARAVITPEARAQVPRAASVALPLRASEEVLLEDETSHVALSFALERVHDTPIEVAGDVAVYRGALEGADLVHHVSAEGTEDFAVFESRPAVEELRYSVGVARVPGLRLVSNTLEFLDATGAPALRVAPPYLLDAKGKRHEATLAVSGCAYDTSPVGPWGRPVVRPGAARCTVRVTWGGGVAYPAVVDPVWGATGSMVTGRGLHTASVLASGRVLIVGGAGDGVFGLASAELYDLAGGVAGAFAATGAPLEGRFDHTASTLPSGKVLVAGGARAAPTLPTYLSSAELYDPALGTFAATGRMNTPRYRHAEAALRSGKVLITGGSSFPGSVRSSAELYDPAGDGGRGAFSYTATMGAARNFHRATILTTGKVLITGGSAEGVYPLVAELYDPAADAFSAAGSMSVGRALHTATLLPSDRVLVAGGSSSESTLEATAELFDPVSGGFSPAGRMSSVRKSHTATVLPTGKVLIAGGDRGNSLYLTAAEVFDPRATGGGFTSVGSMLAARGAHTASLLPQGLVLIVGGGITNPAAAELLRGTGGEACTSNAACATGFCVDGVCCDVACDGVCARCDRPAAPGVCGAAEQGAPPSGSCAYLCDGVAASCPSSCAADAACAKGFFCAAGACVAGRAPGAACACAAGESCRACATGFCVDGVCCDTACNGTCQACAAAVKSSGVDDGICGTVKDGLQRGEVFCGPGATCVDDHTSKDAFGARAECAPYKCSGSGVCGKSCASSNDCVAPTICASNGRCVEPSPDAGCAVAAPGAAAPGGVAGIVLGLVLAGWRRRRRR